MSSSIDGEREMTTTDIIGRSRQIQPTSVIKREQVESLRNWAEDHMAINHWINLRRSARWNVAGNERNHDQQQGRAREGDWVGWTHAVTLRSTPCASRSSVAIICVESTFVRTIKASTRGGVVLRTESSPLLQRNPQRLKELRHHAQTVQHHVFTKARRVAFDRELARILPLRNGPGKPNLAAPTLGRFLIRVRICRLTLRTCSSL